MKKFGFIIFALLGFSCAKQEKPKAGIAPYFDIASYFAKEASKLKSLNPTINKEVYTSGTVERKNLKISDWQTELTSFSNADINKDSWKGAFKELNLNGKLTYVSNNEKIPIKKVEIIKDTNGIAKITIIKLTNNMLYSAADTLIYTPNNFYEINTSQKIKFFNPKKYRIIGKFNNH